MALHNSTNPYNDIILNIIRRPEVLTLFGFSKSTLFYREQDGLMVPPISLGGRACGYLEHECQAVLKALVAGKSKYEIRQLVRNLVAQRQQAA